MGRRSRRRSTPSAVTSPPAATRIARVRVDEATWAEFRSAICDRSVAEVLGRYVELEVARARRARAGENDVTHRELVDAVERARLTAEALERVRQRLEGLLPGEA